MSWFMVWDEVRNELKEARAKYDKFHSPHEGLSVIEEEFEELKREVFKKPSERDIEKLRTEATHLAAMSIRFLLDILGDDEE